MKDLFEQPFVEMVSFEAEDIITASNDLPEVCVRGRHGPQVYLLTQQTLSTHNFD